MRSRREQALALAEIGLKIFPLPPRSKEPYAGFSWSAVMSSDKAQINAWFDEDQDINYGVCPGEDFVVIDLDEKNGKNGVTNFTEMNMEQPVDDWCLDTFAVKTPSGGVHLYMRVPYAVANSASKIGNGIDVRGARGYVVGPLCYTEEVKSDEGKIKQWAGHYTIDKEMEPCIAPQWLLDGMNQHFERQSSEEAKPLIELDIKANIERAEDFLHTRAPAVEGQGGDEWTYRTIAKLKDFGVSEETALGLLTAPAGWNHRCSPPWSVSDLQIKVQNAYRYGQNKPGNKGDMFDLPGAFSAEDYLASMRDKEEAVRHSLEDHYFTGERLLNSPRKREMVIPEWLPAHGFTAFLATRGSGKTVNMMDIALRLATDDDWHGLPMKDGWAAVYICGEDDVGARDHFRAWTTHFEKMPNADRFHFMDIAVNLMSADDVRVWAEFLREKLKGRRCVVFVDTWQRATSTADQNDNVEMQTAVHHAEALARSLGGPALIAFHPPKGDATVVLGSSVIENSSSAIWSLEQENEFRRLTVTRIKGKGRGNFQVFEYKEVDLGEEDDFGERITGIYPFPIAGTRMTIENDPGRLDVIKDGYANAVKMLIDRLNQNSEEYQSHRDTYLSIKRTADLLFAASTDQELGPQLAALGIKLENPKQTAKMLTKFFKDDPKMYDFGKVDGQTHGAALQLRGEGNRRAFVLFSTSADQPLSF